MDLFLKFLILSSKYLSHLTAQSIVQAYRRSLQLGRTLNYQYNRKLSVLTNYENVLELYNANLEEFQRINPNAHLAFISEEHRQEFESYLKDVDLLEDSVVRKSTYVEQLRQSLLNATKVCVTNVIQFGQELDQDGYPSPRRTNEDSKLPSRETRESLQLSPRSVRIMPAQGEETLDHVAEFINRQSQYIKDANDNFRQLQAEISKKYDDLERNKDQENEQESDESDFSERLKILQETVKNCAKLMKVVQEQFDRHEANLNTQKLFASIDTIITEVEHITEVLRVNEDQFQKLEHFINLKAKGSPDEDTAKLIHVNLEAYNKLVCKLMQKQSGLALTIKPDDIPDLSNAIPIANTIKLFLFHEEQRNMAAVLEANQKAFAKFELSMKYPLIGRWNNKTKRLMRGGPRPNLPNKINDRTSKRHSFGKSPFSKRRAWRKQSNFLCPYNDEFTAQNYAALSSSWLKDEQNSNTLNVELNEICVDYKFDKSPESMVTEAVPFEMYAASANLEDDNNNEAVKDAFIVDPHLDNLVDQLLSATRFDKDGLIKAQSVAPYSTQTTGTELNNINIDKNNMDERVQALRTQSAKANFAPNLNKIKPTEKMEQWSSQEKSEPENNINFTQEARSETDAIREMDITITCNDLSLDNDSIAGDVNEKEQEVNCSSVVEEPHERFIDVLQSPTQLVSYSQFCKENQEQLELIEQQKKLLFQQQQQQVSIELKKKFIHAKPMQEHEQQQLQKQQAQMRNNESVHVVVQSPIDMTQNLSLLKEPFEQKMYQIHDTISLSASGAELNAAQIKESTVSFTCDPIDVSAIIREMTEELHDDNLFREMQEGNKLQDVTDEMNLSANQLVHEFKKQETIAKRLQHFLSSTDLKSTSGSITVTIDQLDENKILQAGSDLRNEVDDTKETGKADNAYTILTSNEEQSNNQQSDLSQHQLSLSAQMQNLEKAKQQLQSEIDIPAIISDLNGILTSDKETRHSSSRCGIAKQLVTSDKLKKLTTKPRKVVKSHAVVTAKSPRDKTILTPNTTELKANTRRISSNKTSAHLLRVDKKAETLKLDMSTNRKGGNIKLPITMLKLPKINKNSGTRTKSLSKHKSDVSISRSYRFDTAKPIIKSMIQNLSSQTDAKPSQNAINVQESKTSNYSRASIKGYSKNVYAKDQRELKLLRAARTIPSITRMAIEKPFPVDNALKLGQNPEDVIDFKYLKEHLNSRMLNVDEQKTLSVDDYKFIDNLKLGHKQGSDRSRSNQDKARGNENVQPIDMMSQVAAIQMATERIKSYPQFHTKQMNPIKSSPIIAIKPSRNMAMATKKSAPAASASRPIVRTPVEEESQPRDKSKTKRGGNIRGTNQVDTEPEFIVHPVPAPALSTVDRVTENLRELSAQNMPVQEVKINLVVNPAEVEVQGKGSDEVKSIKSGDSVLEVEGENIDERMIQQDLNLNEEIPRMEEGEVIKSKDHENLEHAFNVKEISARNVKLNDQTIEISAKEHANRNDTISVKSVESTNKSVAIINQCDLDIQVKSDTRDLHIDTPDLMNLDRDFKETYGSTIPTANEATIKQKGRLGYMKIVNKDAYKAQTNYTPSSPFKKNYSRTIGLQIEDTKSQENIFVKANKTKTQPIRALTDDKISLPHYEKLMNDRNVDLEAPAANIDSPFIVSKSNQSNDPPTDPPADTTTKNLIDDFKARLSFIRAACDNKGAPKTKQIPEDNKVDRKFVELIAAKSEVLEEDLKSRVSEVKKVLSKHSSRLAISPAMSAQLKSDAHQRETKETLEKLTNESRFIKPAETPEQKTKAVAKQVEKKANVEKQPTLDVSKIESVKFQIEERQRSSRRKYAFDSKTSKAFEKRHRNAGPFAFTSKQIIADQKPKTASTLEPQSTSRKSTGASGIKAKLSGIKNRTFDKSKINSAKLHQFSNNKSLQDDMKVPKLVMRDITNEMNSSMGNPESSMDLLTPANKVDHDTDSLTSRKSGIKPPTLKFSTIRSMKDIQTDSANRTKMSKLREFAKSSLKPMQSKTRKNSDVSIINFSNCASSFVEAKSQNDNSNNFTDVAPPPESKVGESVTDAPILMPPPSPKSTKKQKVAEEAANQVDNALDVDYLYAEAIKTATCVQYENHLSSAVNNPAYIKLVQDLNSADDGTTTRNFNSVKPAKSESPHTTEILESKEANVSESQFSASPRSTTQRDASNSPRGQDGILNENIQQKPDHQRPRSCGIPKLTAHKMFTTQKSPTIIPKTAPSVTRSKQSTNSNPHEQDKFYSMSLEQKPMSRSRSERKLRSSINASQPFADEQEKFLTNTKSNIQCVSESTFKEPVIEGHESFISLSSPRTTKKHHSIKDVVSSPRKSSEPEIPMLKKLAIDPDEEVPTKMKLKGSERERNLKRLIIMDEKIKNLERNHAKNAAHVKEAARFDKTLVTVIEEMRQKKSLKYPTEKLKQRSATSAGSSYREMQSGSVLANFTKKVPKAEGEILIDNLKEEDIKKDTTEVKLAKPSNKTAKMLSKPNSATRKETDTISTVKPSITDKSSPRTRLTLKLVPSLHQPDKSAVPKLSALVNLTAMKQKIERQNKVVENIGGANDLLKNDLDSYSLPYAKRKNILPPLSPELKNVQIVEPKRDQTPQSAQTDKWSHLAHTANQPLVPPNNVEIISEDDVVSIKMLRSPRDLNTSIDILHESQTMPDTKKMPYSASLLSPSEQYFVKHSQFDLQKLRFLKSLQHKVKEQNEEISLMKKAEKTQKKWMFVAHNQNINSYTNNFGQQLVRVKFKTQRDKCYDAEEYHRNLTKHLESLSSFARIEKEAEDTASFVYRPPVDNGGIREARKPSLSDVKATIMKHLRLGS